MFPYSCRPPIPRPEPFSPLPWRGKDPDWGKWIRDRLAEKGALLAFPARAEFPTAGDAPSLYLAEDTGVIYRWNGSGYAVLVDPSPEVEAYPGRGAFPDTGRSGTIYIDASANLLYRWDETEYVLLTSDLSGVESRLADVESKIPAQADAQNQLADKDFVNSSISANTATFRGTYNLVTDLSLTPSATDEQVASAIATKLASLVPPVVPENNDYCFVQVPYNETPVDPDHIERVDRYKCTVAKDGATETRTWGYEFSINNSSFTAAQWAAINSGITAATLLGKVARTELFPAWAANRGYLADDLVIHDNAIYRAMSTQSPAAEWDPTQWAPTTGAEVLAIIRDYTTQSNKPQINGHTLVGNKTAADLGLATTADATLAPIYSQTPTFSEWTILRDGVDVTSQVQQPTYVNIVEGVYGWTCPVIAGDAPYWGHEGINASDALSIAWSTTLAEHEPPPTFAYTGTRVRTDIIGYTLGDQSGKPLASEAEAEALRAGKLDKTTLIAPFSAAATYEVGMRCVYNNTIYRCTTFHDAMPWDPADFVVDESTIGFLRDTGGVVRGRLVVNESGYAHGGVAIEGNDYTVAKILMGIDGGGIIGLFNGGSIYEFAFKSAGSDVGCVLTLDDTPIVTEGSAAHKSKLDATAVAPAFSTDSLASYAVGDHVTYNGKLYKCTTATTGGTWVAAHWTAQNVQTALDAKAPLASPAFTGTPTAPTPAAGDNSTKVATTAFVQGEGANKLDSTSAAPAFAAQAYALNDLCSYNGVVYRCKSAYTATAQSTKPDADTTHWEAKKVSELFLHLTGGGEITGGKLFLVANNVVKAGFEVVNGKVYLVERHSGGGRSVSIQSVMSTLLSVSDKLDSTSAAPAFSTSSTYAIGDHVTYNGALYRCTTAVSTAGAWDASKWTADTMTDPDAVLGVTAQNQLRVVAKDGTLLWAQGYDLASTSSATLACDAVNNFTFADGATTQAFTLPTAPTGKVGDFGLDIDNSANTGAATLTLTGLDTTFSVVVPEGESLTDMLAIAAGELARFYVTLTTFRVNNLPTWHIVKQVVENGGATA